MNYLENKILETDYVIIGSGMAGLSTGIYLLQQGYQVTICEKHTQAGGYVHSFTRKKKYKFDSAVRIVAGAEYGLLNELLNSLGIENRDFFIPLKNVYKVNFPTFSYESGSTVQEFQESLVNQFPHEKDNIERMLGKMHQIYQEVKGIEEGQISILNSELIQKYSVTNFEEFGEEFTKNRDLIFSISALWGYFGTEPNKASALYYSYAILSFFEEGAYYSKNSFSTLTENLLNRFLGLGGTIYYNSEIIKVNVEKNKVISVDLKRNRKIFITKELVVGGDLLKLVNQLLEPNDLPKRYKSKLSKLSLPLSVFQTYIVTDLPLEGLEHENFYFRSLISSDIISSFLKVKEQNGLLAFSISCPSNVDNSLAPPGEKTLVISTFAPYDIGKDWRVIKRNFEDKLIELASEEIPNLKEHILFRESGTPQTLENYTMNSFGSPFGWEQSIKQIYKRPQAITPIENLKIVGHWTNSGGGIVSSILSSYKIFGNGG